MSQLVISWTFFAIDLYENDLPEYTSKDDSLIKISSFIEAWAKEKVLYNLSMINLSQSKRAEIDELVTLRTS